jgi:hypothetical protein
LNQTAVRGTEILSREFGISVVTACTGIFVTGLFFAAVVAFLTSAGTDRRGRNRRRGLVRRQRRTPRQSLLHRRYWPSVLEPAHQLVWQSLVIAIAVGLWLLWAGRATTRTRRAA